MMPLNEAPILIVCDEVETVNALVARITQARGDIVYAANKLEALQHLAQFKFAAAVLAAPLDADRLMGALLEKGVPCCLVDEAAPKPVHVPAPDTVTVKDIDLVVPTLRALLAQHRN